MGLPLKQLLKQGWESPKQKAFKTRIGIPLTKIVSNKDETRLKQTLTHKDRNPLKKPLNQGEESL